MSWVYIMTQVGVDEEGPVTIDTIWTHGSLEDCLSDMFDHMGNPPVKMTGQRIERKFVPQ